MPATEAQKRATRRYDDAHTMRVYVKLNRKTDADIIDRLSSIGNKQGYIKSLIRADIAGNPTGNPRHGA